jgi:hypothetical protein
MINFTTYLELLPFGMKAFRTRALYDDFGITTEEVFFMSGLEFYSYSEMAPIVIKGVKQKEGILLDPICIALYDFYYGAKMALSQGFEFGDTEKKMEMAKMIFKKYNPEKFKLCF